MADFREKYMVMTERCRTAKGILTRVLSDWLGTSKQQGLLSREVVVTVSPGQATGLFQTITVCFKKGGEVFTPEEKEHIRSYMQSREVRGAVLPFANEIGWGAFRIRTRPQNKLTNEINWLIEKPRKEEVSAQMSAL